MLFKKSGDSPALRLRSIALLGLRRTVPWFLKCHFLDVTFRKLLHSKSARLEPSSV
jgi:hypothetical protein